MRHCGQIGSFWMLIKSAFLRFEERVKREMRLSVTYCISVLGCFIFISIYNYKKILSWKCHADIPSLWSLVGTGKEILEYASEFKGNDNKDYYYYSYFEKKNLFHMHLSYNHIAGHNQCPRLSKGFECLLLPIN